MRWTIYNKDGNERVVQWSADVSENVGEHAEPQLEYHGEWMGECYVTLTVKCAVPVDFQIGDYIVYRGEKFVINYDPTVVKKARKGTYGEGFTYDNVKFNALHNELTEVMFLDYVLDDNELHYTSLPVFPFFAASIDDFCDRLQANTNRYCKNNGIAADDRWLFLTPTTDAATALPLRTLQRARSCGMSDGEAMRRWNEAYGSGTNTYEINTDVSISISNQTIWSAMAMIKNNFGLNFINRGRSVIIGSAGLPTNHIFEYGKGNGLYEIERVADSEQQIVTKMYAYGNETNMPVRYYANIGVRCFARPTRMTFGSLTYYFLDMAWNKNLYCIEGTYAGVDGYRVIVSNGRGQSTTAYVADPSALTNISDGVSLDDLTVIVFTNTSFEIPLNGQELNFESGINKDKWPAAHREYPKNLPNNMAVNRLMLPGFPLKSLYQWVKENGGTDCDDTTGKATWRGYTAYFSKDQYQPYILSLNSDELGIRESAKTFDGSDGDEDIFPTIEGTGFDVITDAQQIDDNGIFAEGDDEPTVTLTLPSFGTGFDLKEQAGLGDSPAVVMKDGYCGGRSFSFEAANVVKNSNGTFTVKCKREHDDLLDLWFPYSYNKSNGQPSVADEPYQVCAGDKYVLTGIPMTDAYVEANAVKLLEASLLWLSKNDYTRYTYLPKVDEIYMARQHDEYQRGENSRSLYLTIKEGDLLRFMDEDLHIGDSMIFIDSLTIKEYGNAQIPTYDISLRNDKSVGTIERMQEQINSLTTGTSTKSSGSGGGGMTTNQLNELIEGTGEKLFLSKLKDDVANGLITFVKGLVSKARALFEGDVEIQGLLQGTRARLNSIKSEDYSGDGMGDTGWQITNAYNGHSKLTIDELYVRMKAVFESLEVKERKVSGGDLTFSDAANVIVRTDYLDADQEVLGYDTVKVPWWLMNGAEMFMTDRRLLDIFSREARIKRSFDSLDESVVRKIRYVRCYFLAKDGSGNAVYNMWQMDDLVRCQTFNMQQQERDGGVNSRDIPSEKEGETYSRQQNTFWWRKVTAVSSEPVTIDGRDYHWFDVAYNYDEESRATGNTSWCALGSDIPCAGDNACQFGNTGNPERMNAISIEINGAGNSDAPAIKVYRGIYTFSLKKCWWGGESTRKGMWSPSAGFEVYAPLFKFITEYGTYRETINRGSWLSIEREQDDYGNSVQYEGDDEPTQLVRKCYYYNQLSHKGSIWLCTMANDDFHWVDAYGHYISDSDYSELTDEEKARCTRVQNYTTDEPSETSPAWTKQVERGTGIKTVRSYYAKTAEALVMPRDDGSVTWLESLSALGDIKEGWYVWTKNVTTYTDTIERTTTYTVSRWGIDGDGIHNIETKFYEDSRLLSQSQLAALAENRWVEYASLSLTKGDYIYTRVKITYDKNQTSTISYTVNRIGADGVSYVATEEYYCLGDSRTTPPAKHPYTRTDGKPEKMTPSVMQSRMNGGAWSESRPDYDTSTAESRAKKYLWNFEVGYDTTTQVQVTQPMCVGNYEKGIQSIVELYAISAYAVAPQQGGYPQDITAWTDEAHDCAPTDAKPYQWNKTVTTYSDGSQDVFYHVSAVKGTKGESAFVIDLDNQADPIGTDSTGKTLEAQDCTTGITLFYGTQKQTLTANPTVVFTFAKTGQSADSVIELVSATGRGSTRGSLTVRVLAGKTITDTIYATITAQCAIGSESAVLTLKPIASGAPGVSPVFYRLAATINEAVFSRDDNNNLLPSSGISFKVYADKVTGTKPERKTSLSGYTVRWGWDDNATVEDSKAVGSSWLITTDEANAHRKLWIELWGNTATEWEDREEIPIIKDGKKGDSIKKTAETYRYATNNTGTRPAATSSDWKATKPTLNKGYWLYTETTITWSDGSKTVLYTDERNPNDGIAGQDIIVDGSTVITYCVSETNTQQPADSNFKPYSQVTPEKGKWLWMKATTYYRKAGSAEGAHDAGSSSNYTVSYIALDGSAGRGISRITEYYKATDSSAEMAVPTSDSGWTTNPNNAGWSKEKKYLWNYEKVEYTSGTTVERTKPQILAIWTKDGKGIDSITNYYKITNSPTPPLRIHEGGTGWDDNPMVPTADSPYLWNYEVITYTEGDPTYTDVQQICHYGKDGTNSPYLKNHTIMYALSNDGNTAPASGWDTALLKPRADNKYLWRKDIYEYDANERGRNLLRGTSDLQVGSGTWSSGSVRMSGPSSHGTISRDTTQTLPVTGIDSCIKISKTAGGNTSEIGFAQDYVPMTAGKKIMMSCWIKGTAGAHVRLQPAWINNTAAGSKNYTCNGDWQYVTCEGTLRDYSSWSAGYVYLNTDATVYVCGLKLEYGEDASDWTPAPEDLYREEVSIWSVYGEDGVGLTVNPTTLIFEEKKNDNSKYIDYSNNTVTIQYREGRTLKALTAVKNTQSGISESGWSITGSGTTTVTVTIGSGIQSTVTSGHVEVKLSAGAFSQTVRIPFYVNRVVTWQQTIKDGVETSVAKKLSYSMGEDEVEGIDEVGEYIRGYKENISKLQRTRIQEDLFGRGIGKWVLNDGDFMEADFDPTYPRYCGDSKQVYDIYSPIVSLKAGKYCFSAYLPPNRQLDSYSNTFALQKGCTASDPSQGATINADYTYDTGETIQVNGAWYHLEYAVFTVTGNTALCSINLWGGGSAYSDVVRPKLEAGEIPTPFAVSASVIKQTADEIMAEVGDKASKSELKMTADEIRMSVNRGMRNYILRPKATDATSDSLDNFEKTEVSDPLMGQVVQIYWSGSGYFQLKGGFDKDNRSDLTNQTVTCYMVVKPVSTGTSQIKFGVWGNSDSQKSGLVIALATAAGTVNKVESIVSGAKTGMIAVGSGWYLCWATFNAGNIFSGVEDTAGINSINGSRWQVYGYGVLLGSSCPTLEAIITDTGLRSTGIDIEDGKITLRGDRVTFSNSTGTVSNKIYIDSTTGTLHATDGNFEGEITSTSGTIGGFTIDSYRLYNSSWEAGIDISYDSKTVKIGKNAKGIFNSEDAIIRAENTKTKSQTTDTYNTALYLNASGARYNYAFYGNGNGVLNGLVFGYKTSLVNVSSVDGAVGTLSLTSGATFVMSGAGGNHTAYPPTLASVRLCLGLPSSSTTPFSIEIEIINQTEGNVQLRFRGYTGVGSDYPYIMSSNGTVESGGAAMIEMTKGAYLKLRLTYTSLGYRAYRLVYNHD